MEGYSYVFYIFCIAILFGLGKLCKLPIKKILKLCINSILGAGIIYATNIIGNNFNFHIGLNWWTILISGIMGIPGVILIVFLKLLVGQ